MTIETPIKENRIYFIYCITNLINNKNYIGQTVDPSSRWRGHRRDSANPKVPIQFAIKKYGSHNFKFTIIASCKTQEDANELETLLVSQYESHVSTGKGYNATHGGMNAPKTEAWKQMMRDHWADPEWRDNQIKSLIQAQAVRTPEEKEQTAQLLSEIFSGRHLSPDTEFKSGHKLSEDIINKISASLQDREAWNKDTIEIMKPNETSFQVGNIPYNKGTNMTNSGSFTTGHIPWSKGKTYKKKNISLGENTSRAKLNSQQVLEIVKLYRENELSQQEIAEKFNINRTAVSGILTGRNWNHITNIKN
jgi:group I intron endonuclease